jgi:hypothetical protein
MKDTFNINRFWLLVRRQWHESRQFFLLLWAVISISLLGLSFLRGGHEFYLLDILVFCVGGCAITTTLFSRWSDFGHSSFYLLLPASVTEKFFTAVFYGIILFIPVYCLNYFFIRYILTYLIIMLFPNNLVSFSGLMIGAIHGITTNPYSFYLVIFLSFLFTQSLSMVVAASFKRYQALIILLSIIAILVIYNYGMGILMTHVANVPNESIKTPGVFLTYFSSDFSYGVNLHQTNGESFSFIKPIWILNDLAWFVVFIMLYVASRFKLKEREL